MANEPINVTAQQRDKRALETRDKDARPVQWRPANALPSPDPQDGYVFHWKRKSMMGQDDPRNMATARREGWVPCLVKDHPEFADDFAVFGSESSNGIIEMGGLVLCKTTKENAESRKDYYSDITRKESDAVNNNFMREQDRRMPMFNESSSRTQFRN
jgi:hypothetical protein